jgi:D-aspartate ligase
VVLGGWESGLAVTRSLARDGLPVVSVSHASNEYGRLSKHVSRAVVGPDPYEEEEAYLTVLERLGRDHPGALLVPSSDESLTLVSKHKERLEGCFTVGSMAWDGVEPWMDKAKTHEIAARHGIPAPRTFSPGSFDELEGCVRLVGFPCLVKPRLSHVYSRIFGRKMEKVHGPAELSRAWRAARDRGVDVLVQEFVPGPDHNGANYNAYVSGGEVWADCTAHKLRSLEPEIASPRLVLSRDIPEVADLGRRLVVAAGIEGFANVEFKRDERTGVFRLMEINCRHNMSTALSIRCGMNFPLMEYRHRIVGERTAMGPAAEGVYWISLTADLRGVFRELLRKRVSARYFRPYASPHVYDYLDLTDPAPFLEVAGRGSMRVAGRIRRTALARIASCAVVRCWRASPSAG